MHANPVNFNDPTGMFIAFLEACKAAHKMISALHWQAHKTGVEYGYGLKGLGNLILPDIVNYREGQIGEIKILSIPSIALGYVQLRAAINFANGLKWTYHGKTRQLTAPIPHGNVPNPWVPEDWDPGVQLLVLGTVNPLVADWVAITIKNMRGLILYMPIKLLSPCHAHALAYALAPKLIQIGTEMERDIQYGWDSTKELLYEYRLQAEITAASLTAVGVWGLSTTAFMTKLQMNVYGAIASFLTPRRVPAPAPA